MEDGQINRHMERIMNVLSRTADEIVIFVPGDHRFASGEMAGLSIISIGSTA